MKRRLFKLTLSLLLGVIVNVAVAWGCALLIDPNQVDTPEAGVVRTQKNSLEVAQFTRFGITAWATTWGKSLTLRPLKVGPDPAILIPYWIDLDTPSQEFQATEYLAPGELLIEYRYIIGYGWPMKGFWCEPHRTIGSTNRRELLSQGGFIKIPLSSWQGKFPRVLPTRIIWPGFAINTIFYAVIVWLLWSSPFAARRMIRRKRGRCIKCGYNLRGDYLTGCPECGLGREEASEQGSGDE